MFNYIGLKIVRKLTFGKTTEIWYNGLPKAEVILLLVDAIKMAQF